MAKKSYALRNRHGYMDSAFDDGLRIVLQWIELRRRDFERQLQIWQKELYMMRRMWIARSEWGGSSDSELPGGWIHAYPTVKQELAHYRYYLRMNGGPLAPGY